MGFLRTMFGSGLSADDPRVFFVEAMVGAIDADGEVTDSELEALHNKLDTHDLFSSLSKDAKERLIDQAADAIEAAGGGRSRAADIAKGLPGRTERELAYTLACEMTVADNDLAEKEIAYLEALQEALGLPDETARELFESLRKKSSVLTIEERMERTKALIPRFIDAMCLLTLADGKVDDTEIDGIEAVLKHISDMRTLSEEALHDEVVASFDRLEGKSVDDVLKDIRAVINTPNDCFWTVTYMMIVAVADGVKDWQELGLLAQFQKAFGLDNKSMDSAMKIAAQFPNVKITGRAPV